MNFDLKIKQSSILAFLIIFLGFVIFQIERFVFSEGSLSFIDLILLFVSRPGVITVSLMAVCLKEFKLSNNLRFNKTIFIFFVFINLIITFADQIFYQVFHTQLSLSFSEGAISEEFRLIFDSVLKEITITISVCTFLVFGSFGFLIRKELKEKEDEDINISQKKTKIILFFLTLNYLSFFIVKNDFVYQRSSYAPIKLLRDTFNLKTKRSLSKDFNYNAVNTKNLIHGNYRKNISENEQLIEIHKKLNKDKTNIIFFILESVGSLQIAPGGEFESSMTPNISKRLSNVIFFENIYNYFPATTRSHVPITTGGETITWGSVNRELMYKYNGLTLPKYFNEQNFSTALFSSMYLGYENLNLFYKSLGFEHVFDPDDKGEDFKKDNTLHSWGVDENIILKESVDWLKGTKKPFYIQFLTNSTHHPYAAPDLYLKKHFPDYKDDKFFRYKTAIHYTDSIIEKLIKYLDESNLSSNTLIFLTGDHGQAFSKIHQGNWTHKNYLYDENIKNFLLIIDPSKKIIDKHLTSSRKGSLGDIFPTIASINSEVPKELKGQNLFSEKYTQQLIFFHKNSHPELWGLIDGDYKYISSKMGEGEPELYNLKDDPREQSNIISKHQNKIKLYNKTIKSWYLKTNDSFSEKLDNYKDRPEMRPSDLTSYGPKSIYTGIHIPGAPFQKKKIIHPNEDMSIWTQGVSFPKDTNIHYEFISPDKTKRKISFTHKKDWSSVKVFHRPLRPMQEGVWEVVLYNKNQRLISSKFTVDKGSKLDVNLFKEEPGIMHLSFGGNKPDGEFLSLPTLHPREDMKVQILLRPFKTDQKLHFYWYSPSKLSKKFYFIIKKGWDKSWVYHKPKEFMVEGEWRLLIKNDDLETLIEKKFNVSKKSILLTPVQ